MDPIQNQNNPVESTNSEKKSFGPAIGIAIIIVILILGALYFWGGTTSQSPISEELPAVSQSDEINSIEEDLSAGAEFEVDFSDLEADLEAELQ